MKHLAVLTLTSAALLLASCSRDPRPSDLTTLTGTVVEGRFAQTGEYAGELKTSPWTGGAGAVRGYMMAEDGISEQPATTGALAADGRFNLTLPTPAAAQLVTIDTDIWAGLDDEFGLGADCSPQLSVSKNGVRSAVMMLEVEASKAGPVMPFVLALDQTPGKVKGDVRFGGLIYVDQSVTVQGSRTCTVGGIAVSTQVDLRLGKGWNKMQFAVSADEAARTGSTSITSGTLPSDWVFFGEGMSPLGTGSNLPRPAFLRQ